MWISCGLQHWAHAGLYRVFLRGGELSIERGLPSRGVDLLADERHLFRRSLTDQPSFAASIVVRPSCDLRTGCRP
jgi:hypothetical protein